MGNSFEKLECLLVGRLLERKGIEIGSFPAGMYTNAGEIQQSSRPFLR